MTSLLGPAAPAFDQPLAMLDACHGRIQAQLTTLRRLAAWLPAHGADEQARQAANAILRYFIEAAPHHHQDEEEDLLPALSAAATASPQREDVATVQALSTRILYEHGLMDAARQSMLSRLQMIVAGDNPGLAEAEVEEFAGLYERHIVLETEQLLPLAERLLPAAVQAELGQRMARRRGA